MAIIRVYPAPGRKVREPNTMRAVPPEGIEVSDSDLYWVRRLRDKDVVTVKPAPALAKPAAPAAASGAVNQDGAEFKSDAKAKA
jgi:hypothetical protein